MASVTSARAIDPHCNVNALQDSHGVRMTLPGDQMASNEKENQQTQPALLGFQTAQKEVQGNTMQRAVVRDFDMTGQIAPVGTKPRVNATLWEEGGTLCFQVDTKGVCVARREDNHMINGTKLLNVAGMARGRRDGILKAEPMRHIVKTGPMHLKGVWIPFERALDFANKERITPLLYPLFVHNIGALLYHPTNQTRTNIVRAAAERRKQEQAQMQANRPDQNPPCNTLNVRNLPVDTSEDELIAMFSKQRGYKRLCFRSKQDGPLCSVEFENIFLATKALHELDGHSLQNSIKGGVLLSFSKNPLGVRSTQGTASAKLRVENLHYDVTEDDLTELFNRIGPVLNVSLNYDRAGRSEGLAFVTYKSSDDAEQAIRDLDGANAKGQPIRLFSIASPDPGPSSNPPSWTPFALPTLATPVNFDSFRLHTMGQGQFVWRLDTTLLAQIMIPPPSPRSKQRDDSMRQMDTEPLLSNSSLEIRLEYNSQHLGNLESSSQHLTSLPEVKEDSTQAKEIESPLSTQRPTQIPQIESFDAWLGRTKQNTNEMFHNLDNGESKVEQSQFPDANPSGAQVKSEVVKLEVPRSAHRDSSVEFHGMDDIREIVLHTIQFQGSSTAKTNFLENVTNPKNVYDVEVSIHWGFKNFFEEQFEDIEEAIVGSVIVLTGTGRLAQATTVRQYLDQTWSGTDTKWPILLRELQQALTNGSSVWKGDNFALEIQLEEIKLGSIKPCSVGVTGSAETIVQTLQQLAWLGSALQTSGTGRIGHSQARLSSFTQNDETVKLELLFLTDSIPYAEKSCWHDLFVNPVVAYNFPIPARDSEIGLEISIPMMAALGGTSQTVEFAGGLVIKGFSTMFVPVSRSGNSVQWHFICNENEDRLEFWQADKQCPGRALLKDVDQDALRTTRAFVGWWGKTTTHLGTADADYGNLDWSATRELPTPPLGRNIIDLKTFGLASCFLLTPKDSRFQLGAGDAYRKIIRHASKTQAVLYDTGDKRGWLVPLSAVIAHITQTRHFRDPFFCDDKVVSLVTSNSAQDIYEASESMLTVNASVKLSSSDAGSTGYYFRDLVNNIWTSIENLMDQNSCNEEPLAKRFLHGWEFMDIVEEMSHIRQKETQLEETSGHWIDLARDINALVFFANGFGNIIRPAAESMDGLCKAWGQVPKDKDYLTAGVPILNALYEKAGSRVTKKHLTSTHLQWDCGPLLFENCAESTEESCNCDRIQSIVDEARMLPRAAQLPSILEPQGALIFGQSKPIQRTETQRDMGINTQNPYIETNIASVEDKEIQITDSGRTLTALHPSGWNARETFPTTSDPESEDETDYSDINIKSSYAITRRPKRPHDETDLNQDYRRVQRAHPNKSQKQFPVRESARKSVREPKTELECSNGLESILNARFPVRL